MNEKVMQSHGFDKKKTMLKDNVKICILEKFQ